MELMKGMDEESEVQRIGTKSQDPNSKRVKAGVQKLDLPDPKPISFESYHYIAIGNVY